jgi:hypothetical protein
MGNGSSPTKNNPMKSMVMLILIAEHILANFITEAHTILQRNHVPHLSHGIRRVTKSRSFQVPTLLCKEIEPPKQSSSHHIKLKFSLKGFYERQHRVYIAHVKLNVSLRRFQQQERVQIATRSDNGLQIGNHIISNSMLFLEKEHTGLQQISDKHGLQIGSHSWPAGPVAT